MECLYNLAHELGGAIASYMGMSKQTVFEFEPSRLINEIAAFVNEKLLTDYLLHSSSNEREKKVIMLKSLERMRENLFQCLESAEIQIKKQKITCELFIEALKFGTSKSNEEIIEFLGCETDINVLLNKQVSTIQDLIMSINKEQE